MKDIRRILGAFALLGAVCLSDGCGKEKVSADTLITEFEGQLLDAQDVTMKIKTEYGITMRFETVADTYMEGTVNTTVDQAGKDAHVVVRSVSNYGEGEDMQEDYYVYNTEEERLVDYVCDIYDDVIYVARTDEDFVYQTDILHIKERISDISMDETTCLFEGTECYVLKGRMLWNDYKLTIGQDAAFAVPDIPEGTELSDLFFDVSIYFAKEDHALKGFFVNAKDATEAVIGRSVVKDDEYRDITEKMLITVTDIQLNTGIKVELPDDVEYVE